MKTPFKTNGQIKIWGALFTWMVSVASLVADPIEAVANKFRDSLREAKCQTVAVLNFPYIKNRFSTGSYLVSERLTTYLVQRGVTVVERRLVDKILEERMWMESGAVDPSFLSKIGPLTGVQAVAVGTLEDETKPATLVNARLIQCETGNVIGSLLVTIPRQWDDWPRLPRNAQPRASIPVGYQTPRFGTGRMESARKDPAAIERKFLLSDLDRQPKKPVYRMAPMPAYWPAEIHPL